MQRYTTDVRIEMLPHDRAAVVATLSDGSIFREEMSYSEAYPFAFGYARSAIRTLLDVLAEMKGVESRG